MITDLIHSVPGDFGTFPAVGLTASSLKRFYPFSGRRSYLSSCPLPAIRFQLLALQWGRPKIGQ